MSKFTCAIDKTYRKDLERLSNLETERKRRDRLYIIAEILTIAQEGSLKTQIMYRANLSFAQLNEYLSFLVRLGLLKVHDKTSKKVYKTTARGEKYLYNYEQIAKLLGSSERKTIRIDQTLR